MTKTTAATAPVLGTRALGRATLARQLLLERSPLTAAAAVEHLLGLQAQNVKPPYYALAARLDGFEPEQLSRLMADREVVRIVTMRSTIHTHTAADCRTLRPLVQPARDRELVNFRKGLQGVDLDRLAVLARELVETEPRTMKQLREALLAEWPDADPQSLAIAARCKLPLVQVTPRGLWGRSGQVALTTAEHWLGRDRTDQPTAPPTTTSAPRTPRSTLAAPTPALDHSSAPAPTPALDHGSAPDPTPAPGPTSAPGPTPAPGLTPPPGPTSAPTPTPSPDATVLRYLAAFGPASVKDMQTWAGLTRLRDAFERLRPRLVTFRDENGVELFDLPDAPRPDADTPAPPRFLPEFDNLLLSHADRTRVVPPEYWGRSWVGNIAHPTFLVDGFLAGVWKLTEDALVVQPFGRLTKAQRTDLVTEGGRMLDTMHPGTPYDIRFGTVIP
ncbi:winged helix DNA-binding domain-containing protein [Streptomyces cylindrosporus]|uniref:Winged helix DNA-binding domain-containing protein n=1 Tax=Streptomyces cylindrosporus TaxID=2927583 RepID=A0ABS9Y2E6_9ACTN|nr:winged helix DNA-binding domain-containing protein [Streptomyces cylindrosporus]MCI3271377.1 winged helix DNA-binding domain-containing protein [Streptomyces cylindrosporus]